MIKRIGDKEFIVPREIIECALVEYLWYHGISRRREGNGVRFSWPCHFDGVTIMYEDVGEKIELERGAIKEYKFSARDILSALLEFYIREEKPEELPSDVTWSIDVFSPELTIVAKWGE